MESMMMKMESMRMMIFGDDDDDFYDCFDINNLGFILEDESFVYDNDVADDDDGNDNDDGDGDDWFVGWYDIDEDMALILCIFIVFARSDQRADQRMDQWTDSGL